MWYYASLGAAQGPVSEGEIDRLIRLNVVRRTTLVWTAGMPAWAQLKQTALGDGALSSPSPSPDQSAAPPPVPPPDVRPLKPLWGWLRVLLVIYAVFALLCATTLALQIDVLEKFKVGAYKTEQEIVDQLVAADALGALAALGVLFMLLWCFFIWARITYRATRNLEQINAQGLRISPGWAVGWFFIPIAYLWKPFQAVLQIWRSSTDPKDPGAVAVPWWIGLWWAIFLLGNILGATAQFILRGSVDIALLQFGASLDLVACLLDLPLVALALAMWGTITKRQDALIVGIAGPASPAVGDLSPARR